MALCLVPKALPSMQLGQISGKFTDVIFFLLAAWARQFNFSFSLLCKNRCCRLASILGSHLEIALSKLSIKVPIGHIQPQKKLPKIKIGKRNRRSASKVGKMYDAAGCAVNSVCIPPRGQINQAPGPIWP
jgi:hypothetical protein